MSTTVNPEEKAAQAIMILQRVAEDTGVPRNIRRAANAIGILDEIVTDPNMPLFARTAIWQAVSLLEQIKD